MNKDDIAAAQKEVEDRFNDLTNQKSEMDAELLRLQGEWRAYEAQLKKLEPPQPETENPVEEPVNG